MPSTPRPFAPKDYAPPPHSKSFTVFTSPINLTTQDEPTSRNATCQLYLVNKDVGTSFASFTVKTTDGISSVLTLPPMCGQIFRGAYVEITSVSGGTTPEATAWWNDF